MSEEERKEGETAKNNAGSKKIIGIMNKVFSAANTLLSRG